MEVEHLRDPFGIAFWPEFRGRDGSRTPMPWQAGVKHGGFTAGDDPWLPVPDAHHAMAVDVHEEDTDGLLHAFRRFLAWRRSQPALVHGALRPLELPEPLVGFVRELDGESVIAVFNLADKPVVAELDCVGLIVPLVNSGFAPDIFGHSVFLPRHGAFFAALVPEYAAQDTRLATA